MLTTPSNALPLPPPEFAVVTVVPLGVIPSNVLETVAIYPPPPCARTGRANQPEAVSVTVIAYVPAPP